MEQALTPKEAAQLLKVSDRMVLDLLRSGELPGRKVGSLWRISPAALEQYLHGGNDLHQEIAAYAAAVGGTADDLDPLTEDAAAEHLANLE